MSQTSVCYLIHFDAPYRHARHYLGITNDLAALLARHRARLVEMTTQAGIGFVPARTWPGGPARERQLKKQGGHSRHCPICKGEPAARSV